MVSNIRFIKEITAHLDKEPIVVSDYIYYALPNGNMAKTWCDCCGVHIAIINKMQGEVDSMYFPFEKYFKPVRCFEGAELWHQYIRETHWCYELQHPHVAPQADDYINLCNAMKTYISMYE